MKTSSSEDCDLTAGGPLSSLLKGQIVNKPLERLKKRPRPKRPRRPDYKIGNKTWQDNPSDLDECAGYRYVGRLLSMMSSCPFTFRAPNKSFQFDFEI